MIQYWVRWILLTLFKAWMVGMAIVASVGGVRTPEYVVLAVIFVPMSIWFLYDFAWQVRVPVWGGCGYRNHKASDLPMYMGLAPDWRHAKEELNKGRCIIWS